MNRRQFLSFLSVGAAVSTVAPHIDLIERIRTFFFAPRGGWLNPTSRQLDFLLRDGCYTLYGGEGGGGKILTVEQLDQLIQKYYLEKIVAAMQRDSMLVDRIEGRFVGEIAGVPLISSPLVPPDRIVMMRGNWNNRERFPFPGTLRTPIIHSV